jgi:predicted DNA-binding protein YlxM (UPF0122 family)
MEDNNKLNVENLAHYYFEWKLPIAEIANLYSTAPYKIYYILKKSFPGIKYRKVTKGKLRRVLSKKKLMELHYEKAIALTEIAKMYNSTYRSLHIYMKHLNLPTNKNIIRKENPKGHKIRKIELSKDKLYELYYEQKLSLQKIGELYGKERFYIHRWMRKYGFKSRTKSDAWKHRDRNDVYEIKEDFFHNWSKEMSYIFGFILTDGNISDDNNQVSITIKDVRLLEKIRTKLKSNHPIKYLKAAGIYQFSFSRKKMVERLRKLGITSNKSLVVEFPKVPDKFLSDFIRGVFDGDGSVFFESRSKKFPLRVSFTSGSKKFITALEDILHTQAGVSKRTIYKLHRKNTSYYIRYCHKDSLKFFAYIYAGADESMWLERKHRKFLEGMLFTCSITDINKVWDHL